MLEKLASQQQLLIPKEKALILWFDEVGIADIPLVGGKNTSLGEMNAVSNQNCCIQTATHKILRHLVATGYVCFSLITGFGRCRSNYVPAAF